MTRTLICLLASLAAAWSKTEALAQADASDDYRYVTSIKSIRQLGYALQGALKPQYREIVIDQPIAIEPGDLPIVRLEELPEEPKPIPRVVISQGFIELVNRVAHAKAIDKIQKGYFQKYILSLAEESGEQELKPLPNDSDPRFWTDEMKNEQYSNFNSIVGTMVGIKLAHHCLGHYRKHQNQLASREGKSVAINNLLAPKEWEEALRFGTRNALSAGCAIEGVLPFFESFEKMPKRPRWTAFFVPDNAKYRDTRRVLERTQRDFFAGKRD